jgi:hypothetical protein
LPNPAPTGATPPGFLIARGTDSSLAVLLARSTLPARQAPFQVLNSDPLHSRA